MKKVIWTYWHQGFNEAPDIVKICIDRLIKLHPSWQINVLNKENVNSYVDPLPINNSTVSKLSLQHKSDLIRTQLLIKYGGVWIDPTVYCVKPLDQWLESYMNEGLFLFYKPGRDRIISNWFISAESNNIFLKKLYEELCSYWNRNNFRNLGSDSYSIWVNLLKRIFNRNLEWPMIWLTPVMSKWLKLYPYMIYHYMFYYLIKNDEECALIWSRMNKLSADMPHRLQRIGLRMPVNQEAKNLIDNKESPLFKLTWRLDKSTLPSESILEYLINSSE